MGDVTGQETRIHHFETIVDGYHQECRDGYEITGYETVSDQEQVCESVDQRTDVTCYEDASCDYDDVYSTECHNETVYRQEPVYGYVEHCSQVADTHEEPRYATLYFYSVWEWVSITPVVSSAHDLAPYRPTGYTTDEKRRESGTQEDYSVNLITEDGKKTFSYTPVTLTEYNSFQIGTRWVVTHSGGMISQMVPKE